MSMIQLDSTNMFFKPWVVQPISFSIMGWFNQYSFNMGCITTSCFSNIGCQQKNINAFGHHFLFQKQKTDHSVSLWSESWGSKNSSSLFFENIFTHSCLVLSYIFQGLGGTCNPPSGIWKKPGPGGMRPWWFQTFQCDPARRPIN